MFRLGPLTITGYGLMMMVAFLMAGWAIQVDLRRRGMNEDYAADIVFAAVVGGIVGAKIWYVLLTGEWDALYQIDRKSTRLNSSHGYISYAVLCLEKKRAHV